MQLLRNRVERERDAVKARCARDSIFPRYRHDEVYLDWLLQTNCAMTADNDQSARKHGIDRARNYVTLRRHLRAMQTHV